MLQPPDSSAPSSILLLHALYAIFFIFQARSNQRKERKFGSLKWFLSFVRLRFCAEGENARMYANSWPCLTTVIYQASFEIIPIPHRYGMPKEKFTHSTEERKVSQRQEIQTFPLIYNNSIFVAIMRHLQFLHSSLQSYSIFPDARLEFWLISWQRSGERSEQKNRAALSWAWNRLPFFFRLFLWFRALFAGWLESEIAFSIQLTGIHSFHAEIESFSSSSSAIIVPFFFLLLQMIHAQVGWFHLRTYIVEIRLT